MTRLKFRAALLILGSLPFGTLAAQPALAGPRPYHPTAVPASVRTDVETSPGRSQVINLAKGRSAVIDLPADAGDVFVSNPKVADAVLRTPRRIFIMGIDAGVSDALFFDAGGHQILNLSIRVDAPTDELADTVHRLFPGTHIEVQSLNGQVVLSGMAADNAEADQMLRLAQTFADKPEHVVNLMSIAGKDQVTLKVRIVEVNHSVIKQLGMATNLNYIVGSQTVTGQRTNSWGTNGQFFGSSGLCFDQTAGKVTGTGCLMAFERAGLARTLAEPNLTAVSGESAKFLAGGEFPVPVAQDNEGRITVQFKPYGVGLGFSPVVLSSGRISMKISTEVSELSSTNSFTSTSTFTIPALVVRRAETTVEMQSGSSLMMAGLLQSKYKQTVDALPGLTSLPILGSLFRSRDFLADETELVVIVTPYVVKPGDPDAFQTPADNLQIATDASTVFMGRLNKVIRARSGAPAGAPDPAPYQAPVGYVIE